MDGKPILNLPPKSINLKKLSFSFEERSFYTGLEANFREKFKVAHQQAFFCDILLLLLISYPCHFLSHAIATFKLGLD